MVAVSSSSGGALLSCINEPLSVLIIEDAQVRYALPAAVVQEVIRAVWITPLAGAPYVIEGVVDYRSEVAAVLNLRRRFGRAEAPLSVSDRLVAVVVPGRASQGRANQGRTIVLRVDAVVGIATVEPGQIEAMERVEVRSRYVAGAARLEDGLVLIYDVDAFLSVEEMEAVDEALRLHNEVVSES